VWSTGHTLRSKMTSPDRSVSAATKHHNRVAAIMLHTPKYSCYPTSRLAADSGVAKSTISHLLHGRTNPLYSTAARVVKCLEHELHHHLECREVYSEDGSYPTRYVCALVGCRGCTPQIVYDPNDNRKPGFEGFKAGQWTGDTSEFEVISEERSQ
jgi:transcriptional regulator with XRE-family HTH domain